VRASKLYLTKAPVLSFIVTKFGGGSNVFKWLRRNQQANQLLAVRPLLDGVAVALLEQLPNQQCVVRWTEYLSLSESDEPVPKAAPAGAEPAPARDDEDQRASRDRRAGDRRSGDRRTGDRGTDRRSGDRRSGARRAGETGAATGSEAAGHDFERLAPLLQRLVRQRDLRKVPCTGVLGSGDYSLILVDAPDVPPSEIRAAMRWQVKELIDFHIDDAVIDVFDVPERDGRSGRRLYAVAARRGKVVQLIEFLTAAGLNLNTIDIPELALRNLAARLPEDIGGVALIAFERDHGLMTVTRQGALYFSRRVDCGSERLAAALAEGGGSSALESLLDGLTIEIQRSLDFYERHFSQPSIAGIVLAPVDGGEDEVCRYLSAQLGVPTRWLDLHADGALTPDLPAPPAQNCVVAMGAAMRRDSVAL
jgi:MSHA biogenesis protein MshI